MEEWSWKSCHMRLQWMQPPGNNFLPHVAKCRMRSCSPSHVRKPQGPLLLLGGSPPWGPTTVQPTAQMCWRHSIASLSCWYISWSAISLIHLFFLCTHLRSQRLWMIYNLLFSMLNIAQSSQRKWLTKGIYQFLYIITWILDLDSPKLSFKAIINWKLCVP